MDSAHNKFEHIRMDVSKSYCRVECGYDFHNTIDPLINIHNIADRSLVESKFDGLLKYFLPILDFFHFGV